MVYNEWYAQLELYPLNQMLMNAEAEGQAIALKGLAPLRVVGTVNKGDKLYVGANGTAQKVHEGELVGVALESQ